MSNTNTDKELKTTKMSNKWLISREHIELLKKYLSDQPQYIRCDEFTLVNMKAEAIVVCSL